MGELLKISFDWLLMTLIGSDGAVFSRNFLRRSHLENFSFGLCTASRILLEKYLEHDGFRRCRHRVNQSLPVNLETESINRLISLYILDYLRLCTNNVKDKSKKKKWTPGPPPFCRSMTIFMEANVSMDLRMLRSFRVLRPLKLVSRIPSKCEVKKNPKWCFPSLEREHLS